MINPYRYPLSIEKMTTAEMGTGRITLPNNPLSTPIKLQEMICQMVQIPMPNMIFDKNVTRVASKIADIGPNMMPHIITIDVTG